MPRTEMARYLRRATLDHAGAARTGMPVLEFRDARLDRAARKISRRSVLKIGGAAAAGGLVLGQFALGQQTRAAASTRRDSVPRVAVIGAGISGLTAALTLADGGVPATVFEAGGRVGGRMFSERARWGDGQTTEYGGEAMDTGHTVIRELCARFGLPMTDLVDAVPPGGEDVLFFAGKYRSHREFLTDFGPVYKALSDDIAAAGPDAPRWNASTPGATALSNMSVEEWIATRVPGGYSNWIARFLDEAYVVEYGRQTGEQAAVNLVYLMYNPDGDENQVWGASDERFRITGGNQRLPEAIAAALAPGSVRLGWRLEALTRRSDGTQALTFDENGTRRTVVVDRTVLTVPLGVLQRIDLRAAGFDPRMRAAVRTLGMGFCTKLHLRLDSRPWVGHGPWPGVSSGTSFSDTGYQQIWDATAGQPGRAGIAIQYGGGQGALDLGAAGPFLDESHPSVRRVAQRKLGDFEAVVPGVSRHWTGRATLAAWHLDPNTQGAYSCYPVGYCHRYAGYEGQQQGGVHLGGEHTSVDSQGYMNGGAESGVRAAGEILAALG